ncbi:hypothetical protein [Bradyrhizobium sp. CCBAU 051011]|uniref:hypothetical protein n=1 Tax=Bradyrhizobium sp. CCBAU 051011 TaxID=858422 RepID=UPI0013797D3B
MDAAALTDIFQTTKKAPLARGFFIASLNDRLRRLTSNNDAGASNGGANDGGGDAIPSAGGANVCANPSGGGANPSAFGPNRVHGRGPSALLRAKGDRPRRLT